MLRNFFSFVLVALIFLGNFVFVGAQVKSSLPLVYVTEVTLEKDSYKPEEVLKGEFVLLSRNTEDVNNLNLNFSLVEDSGSGSTGFSTELKKITNVSIKASESKVVPFELSLPEYGQRKMKLKIESSMSSGLPLGWDYSKEFAFDSDEKFLNLIATRVVLDTGETFPTDYGPHIYRDKKPSAISVEALLKNTFDEEITVIPEIVVYKWPKVENSETAKERVGQKISIKKNDGDVTISMPLPNFDYEPGVYEGVLYIKDENENLKVSEISFRYIVAGEVVTVHSLSSSKSTLTKDENFEVTAFVTGTPVDLNSEEGGLPNANPAEAVLKVYNEVGDLVSNEKKGINIGVDNNVLFSLRAKDEAKALRGELTIFKDGKEIKKYFSNLSADFDSLVSNKNFFENYFIYIISVVILFSLYLVYVFVFHQSLTGKAFVFSVLLGLSAFSYTNAFILESETGYNTRTAVGVVTQEVFVNRPIEGQLLKYGESFNVEGRVLYPYCSNSEYVSTLIDTWITKGDGSILDLNSDGNPDYKHTGINTVLNATSSVYIGCENARHCWYKPTKDFIDSVPYAISSVIPYGDYRAYVKSTTKFSTGFIFRDFPDGIQSTGYLNFSVVPSSPKQVTAVTGSCGRKVKLTWEPVTGVTGYYLYRSSTPTGTYRFITSVSTTTYTHTAPLANTLYYYKVVAYHSSSLKDSGLSKASIVNATSSAECLLGVCKSYPTPVSSQPAGAGLCDFGVSSPVVSNLTSYNWTCTGESPLASACSATKATAGSCDPAKVYNVDKCCPVALVAGTCPPPPSQPALSGVTYCTPPSASSATIRLTVNSAVGQLPIYHNLQSVSATSSFRTNIWTLTQNTASEQPYFDVTGLATSTYFNYAVTSYNSIGQSSSTLLMYPIKTPAICPICPDGVTPKPPSGICPAISLINNSCTFVKDDPTDPEPARVNRWFSQFAHATGTNPPFTLTWSGDVPAADFSITPTASTSKLRTRYDAPGLKNLNIRVRDSAGNEINRSCNITVYCPDGTLNCAGTLIPSISRIDNSCLFPTTKNTIYFNSNSAIFPVNYKVYRKKTGDPDISYVKLGSGTYTFIQNSPTDAPVFVDDGLPMVKSYTYRVWASNAYNPNVYSAPVSSTTGFCSGTVCPDGSSALPDGTCQVFSQPTGELKLDELFVWPPRVNHGQTCKVYIRKVTGDPKKLFATVPPGGASCSITGPIESSFPGGIDPSSFNTKELFELFPTGEIYFISKPVTGTSVFEVSCSDGSKISNTCNVAPIQSDTSFFEKIFKVGSSLKESLVGALLFSLGFGEEN